MDSSRSRSIDSMLGLQNLHLGDGSGSPGSCSSRGAVAGSRSGKLIERIDIGELGRGGGRLWLETRGGTLAVGAENPHGRRRGRSSSGSSGSELSIDQVLRECFDSRFRHVAQHGRREGGGGGSRRAAIRLRRLGVVEQTQEQVLRRLGRRGGSSRSSRSSGLRRSPVAQEARHQIRSLDWVGVRGRSGRSLRVLRDTPLLAKAWLGVEAEEVQQLSRLLLWRLAVFRARRVGSSRAGRHYRRLMVRLRAAGRWREDGRRHRWRLVVGRLLGVVALGLLRTTGTAAIKARQELLQIGHCEDGRAILLCPKFACGSTPATLRATRVWM
jgi:hypothetical protein